MLVLNSDFIELAIINAHSKGTILFLYKQNRSTPWRNTRSNKGKIIRKVSKNSLTAGTDSMVGIQTIYL